MIRKTKADKPIESPMEAMNELQAKLEEAETELAGYRSVHDIAAIELKDLREKLALLEAEGTDAKKGDKAEYDALVARANQAEYFSAQLETARATIATLEQEMVRQPAISPSAHAEVQEQAVEQAKELAKLRKEIQDRDHESQKLKAMSSSSEGELLTFKVRAEEAEEQLTALRAEMKHATAELKSLRAEVENYQKKGVVESELRANLHEVSTKFTAAQQAVSDMRRDLQAKTGQVQHAQGSLKEAQAEVVGLKAEILTLHDQLSKLQNAASEIQALERRLAAAEIELETYDDVKKAKEEFQHRAALLEAELSEARASTREVVALQEEVQKARNAGFELAQLRAQIFNLRTALVDVVSHVDEVLGYQNTPGFQSADEVASVPNLKVA